MGFKGRPRESEAGRYREGKQNEARGWRALSKEMDMSYRSSIFGDLCGRCKDRVLSLAVAYTIREEHGFHTIANENAPKIQYLLSCTNGK